MSNQQAKLQRRVLIRITTLIIDTFSLVTRVTDRRILLRQETVGKELHLFFCRKENLGHQYVAQESGYTSIEAKDAMKAHNHCVFVCKLFAGILAWLLEELRLPISIEEVDLDGVFEPLPVVGIDVISGERRRIALIRTMFKIVSSNACPQHEGLVEGEGLYIDASAPQYLRAPGVYAVRSYPVDPRTTAARPPRCTHLGGAYMIHLQELCEATSWRNFRLEAIIKTVNNEVYGKIAGLGGHSTLANKSVGEWKGLEQWILTSINVSLQSLVAKLDHVHIPPGVDRKTHHKLIATDCFGTGHERIIGSLERVSRRVQVTRWRNL